MLSNYNDMVKRRNCNKTLFYISKTHESRKSYFSKQKSKIEGKTPRYIILVKTSSGYTFQNKCFQSVTGSFSGKDSQKFGYQLNFKPVKFILTHAPGVVMIEK